MRKNERSAVVRVRLRGYTMTLGGTMILAAAGLGLVRQHQIHNALANEARQLDRQIATMEQRVIQAQAVYTGRRSPRVLMRRIEEFNLGLVPVVNAQRIELTRTEPVPKPVPVLRATNPKPAAPSGGQVPPPGSLQNPVAASPKGGSTTTSRHGVDAAPKPARARSAKPVTIALSR